MQIMEICILPWVNKSILKAIRKRNTLFRIAKQTGKQMDQAKYKAKRNQVVKMLWESKQTFFNSRLNNADTKTFWKTLCKCESTCSLPYCFWKEVTCMLNKRLP